MTKTELRKVFTEKRKTISDQQKMKWDDLLLIQFQKLNLSPVHIVFSYLPTVHEVNTDAIVRYLAFRNPGLQVTYPACDLPQCNMKAILTNEDTRFYTNKFGIPEPEMLEEKIIPPADIDLLLIPLLCFDKKGYRVGYGKGFYDKYLADVRDDALKIGLSYFEAIDIIDDRNEFDVPLDYCITPERIYEF